MELDRGAGGERIPETLEEAYGLRDAAATPEEWDFYQEHVYRLRAQRYRARDIRFGESLRPRERRRAETLQDAGARRSSWWKRIFGWR